MRRRARGVLAGGRGCPRARAALLVAGLGACAWGARHPEEGAGSLQGDESIVVVRPGADLQAVLERLPGPARVELRPGHYRLRNVPFEDPTCGNCENPSTRVAASRGLCVSGQGIRLVGASADSVTLHTNAGYGILFEDCRGCGLSGLTVTDGVRDRDGNATDAAIVVRSSSVVIEDCVLRDNIGDSAVVAQTVVGIIGVAGREGADFIVRHCHIKRNSWDGIALYRGARATIHDNVIDGIDKAAGAQIGGGRGVGIGLTWDAQAEVEGNLVTRYWKGIGIFVDAQAEVAENVVEDVLTWGIAYWDAGRGRPVATIHDNVVYRTGACGASLTREDESGAPPGSFSGNAVVLSGQNPRYDDPDLYCRQEALALERVPQGFVIGKNLFHANRESGDRAGRLDSPRREFLTAVAPLLERLKRRPALRASLFLRDYGGS